MILSPHPDDAVLSLWHVLAGPEEAQVLTVFNGPADGNAAPGWWDRLTGADDALQRARERADEDREALALAGRTPTNLGFVDGQYRNGEQELEPLVDAIAGAAPEDGLILAPAALDRHRDHLATRAAAFELHSRGWSVALYADVPHATVHGWPAWVTGEPANPFLDPDAFWDLAMTGSGISLRELDPQAQRLSPEEETQKRQGVDCYRTQLPALETQFSMLARPEILRFEVVWSLPASQSTGQ